MGKGISKSGGSWRANWQEESNLGAGTFLLSSMAVEMRSLPWMQSWVGRTISEISSYMPSKPSPSKGPPSPEMGIFPISVWYLI